MNGQSLIEIAAVIVLLALAAWIGFRKLFRQLTGREKSGCCDCKGICEINNQYPLPGILNTKPDSNDHADAPPDTHGKD